MVRVLADFLRSTDGRVQSGGVVIYVVILGLFMSIAAAMGSDQGPRRLAGHSGPVLELDIRGWFEGTFGGPLPQVGPLSGR